MKNKFLVVCMILVSLATASSYANNNPKDKGASPVSNYEAVIGDYITGFMNTDYKKLDNVLSDNACVKIPRQEKVITLPRTSLIESMREQNGTKQNCTSSYQIIAQTGAIVIARVDFQYAGFKQQNFITMEKNEDLQWKITQVCRISQNNDTPAPAPQNVVAAN